MQLLRYLLSGGFILFSLSFAMTQTPDFAPVKTIELPSGVTLAYTDQGTGETTLVFIHGLGSNHKCWQKNMDTLSRHARCIAMDLPGYGASESGDWAYDMSFFAAVVGELIDALKLSNVTLVGHSMGAQIAIHLTLQRPELCKNLILLAPAGFETFNDAEKAWFGMVMTPDILKATPPEQIRKNFEINFFSFPKDAEFMIADRMALRDDAAAYDSYCRMIPKCVSGMLTQPVFDRLDQIKANTLVIYGENDYLIPNRILHPALTTLQVAQSGQSKIPHSALIMAPQSGHFVQWDASNIVNAAIIERLRPR